MSSFKVYATAVFKELSINEPIEPAYATSIVNIEVSAKR
jgi:hypothetical protein